MSGGRIIGIDFDGTCTTHKFPEVGEDIGAAHVLRELTDNGHKLILFTMRSNYYKVHSDEFNKEIICEDIDEEGLNAFGVEWEYFHYLEDAVKWFEDNNIPLYGIQKNPTQDNWTTSPKAYCQIYIDDAALGCPLVYPVSGSRPYVDWVAVRGLLQLKGLI